MHTDTQTQTRAGTGAPRRTWALVLLLAVGLLLAFQGGTLDALSPLLSDAAAQGSGTPARPGAAAPTNPRLVWGARMFDQAIAWINDNKPGINNVKSFYADLHDVQLDVEDTHQEGFLRLYFQAPDKYRQEWRQERHLTNETPRTLKILQGDRMWIVPPSNVVRRMHGTAEGAKAIRQLKQDRSRLADIAKFLTLSGLKGPGVKFEYLGPTEGTGTFKGKWVKIRRTFPGGAEMEFFFAYEVNADRRVSKVTYPGVVVVKGDAARKEPTEAYILSNWKKGKQFHYPRKIEAFSRREWQPSAQYRRFLLAFPMNILMNPDLDARYFADPSKR